MGKFLTRTWVISLLLTLPLIIFLPIQLSLFRVSLKQINAPCPDQGIIYYRDLDNDGNMERILSFFNLQGMLSFQVFDMHGGLYDQWNFNGSFPERKNHIYFRDINLNGKTEVFCFSYRSDSVFLNYVEPLGAQADRIQNIFISTVNKRKEISLDFTVSDAVFADLDLDGFDEILFNIHGGYSLEPRKIFAYDFRTNSFIHSARAGTVINHLQAHDLDRDGFPEFYGTLKSNLNIPDDYIIPYSDDRAWLLTYNHQLDYSFTPVAFPEGYSYLFTSVLEGKDFDQFIVFYTPFRSGISDPILRIYEASGKLTKEKILSEIPSNSYNRLLKIDANRFLLLTRDEGIYEIGPSLELGKRIIPKINLSGMAKVSDLNRNHEDEILFINPEENQLLVLSNNLMHQTTCDLPEAHGNYVRTLEVNGQLHLQAGAEEYLITYQLNPAFTWRILLYFLIFILLYLLIIISNKIQERRTREKYELDAQIRSLEMNAFHNQIDPHFTFNVFNLVASLIKKGKQEEALDSFMKFSGLIRKNLESFDNILRPLSEELEVVHSFMDIAQLRYPDKLDFEIKVAEEVHTTLLVPKMIVLTNIENAIKHGLKPKKEKGHIQVSVEQNSAHLQITITDDGIGRTKAALYNKESTGMGLKILEKIIAHLNMKLKQKIQQEIIDLYTDEGEASGTKIELSIPTELSQ